MFLPGGAAADPPAAFDLQAHRGGRGLTVENTLPAFTRALELGVSTLEMDIAITKDGREVVTHDSTDPVSRVDIWHKKEQASTF
ncbi:glycerophosphodiester phosphodiesterase family protein [Nocardia sp. NPDC004340]